MASPFKEISDHELALWLEQNPDKLVQYVHRARMAGNPDAAWRAATILVDSYQSLIYKWAEKKMPGTEVEEAANGAYVKVIEALRDNPPELVNQNQLRGWVRTIVYLHCAGLYRDPREESRRSARSADWRYEDGNPAMERFISVSDHGFEFAEYKEIVQRNFEALSDEHQLVVNYSVFADLQSADVCEILLGEHGLEYQPNNIDQIAGRFRKKCLGELEDQ